MICIFRYAHHCQAPSVKRRRMVLRPDVRDGVRTSDALIATKKGLFQIHEAVNDNVFRCWPLLTDEFKVPEALKVNLPWHLVGLWKFKSRDMDNNVLVHRDEVQGKLMISGSVINEWPIECLFNSKADQ